MRTRKPRACNKAARLAAIKPLPSEETTPPVIKMNRAMGGKTYSTGGGRRKPSNRIRRKIFPPGGFVGGRSRRLFLGGRCLRRSRGGFPARSDEGRVGKGCVSTWR